jgi:hypothetical protein
MFDAIRKAFAPKSAPRTDPSVVIDDTGVTRILADGGEEKVAWRDLIKVSVLTTDEGPAVEDAFLMLWDSEQSSCVIPFSSPAVPVLLSRFKSLQGFSFEAFIAASSSTRNAEFICWLREAEARKFLE